MNNAFVIYETVKLDRVSRNGIFIDMKGALRANKGISFEADVPRQWYNLAADLPNPLLPPLGPDGKPVSPDQLAPVFPMNLIEQEVSQERWINIPVEVLDLLYRWRPTPLHRAVTLRSI